jgi:alkylation response protein AidB-like acyl-CoA dehydrogenase
VDFALSPEEAAFREELRAWLAENQPLPAPVGFAEQYPWQREWHRRLHTGGWNGVNWPAEYGGRGGTLTQTAIFFEELALAGAPLPAGLGGLALAGPTIIDWGTSAQKDRYLEPILSGEEIWCQGFSEPEAGSDLASLKTFASKQGSDWIVNGQKVWTTFAQYSRWCMLLARTDRSAEKHRGLTYFLLDMEQEGVQVRPLKQITGDCEFNELFIDGARVAEDNVLGGVGNGWRVALTTLMHERAGLSFFSQVQLRHLVERLISDAVRTGAIDNPVIADKLADFHIRSELLRLMGYRGLSVIEQQGTPGPEGSLTYWLWSETTQLASQLAVEIVGFDALMAGNRWSFELQHSQGNTIAGGTTEILKSVIAERVLGLPRSSR